MRKWIPPLTAAAVATPAILFLTMIWTAAGWLVEPPRKVLTERHREWLAHPAAHGLRIRRGETAAGTPYLLCEPGAAAGERGRLIRRQLAERGTSVGRFGTVRGTLVLLHGRGMRKEDLLLVAERFCAAGFRCLLPDMQGHGENPEPRLQFGTSSAERSLPGEVLESAAARFGFEPGPCGLWGMSLGGAFAVRAAAEDRTRWEAVVVVSSFDELAPVVRGEARRRFGRAAPLATLGLGEAVRWRGGCPPARVRPIEAAARLSMPVMIVHGTDDPLIGIEQGRRLYRAVPHLRKQWIAVAGAQHGNVLVTPQPVFCEMAAFFVRWMTPPRAVAAR